MSRSVPLPGHPGFGVFPHTDTPTAIPMAIPYPVHIGRLRCIVTGCAGRSRYCEFLHTDTHTSITEHCARVLGHLSVTPVFAAYTLPPQLGDMARTHHCTCGSVTARAAVPLDTLFAQLGDAARARMHQCARALLLGLLVDLCYLYDRPSKDQPSEPGALLAHLDMLLTFTDLRQKPKSLRP